MKKQHYHLAAGEISFTGDEPDQVGRIKMNAILRNASRNITAADLGKTQENLQIVTLQKLGNDTQIFDVFIAGFTYLGEMTEDEFKAGRNIGNDNPAPSLPLRGEGPFA